MKDTLAEKRRMTMKIDLHPRTIERLFSEQISNLPLTRRMFLGKEGRVR